jgi:hypothetical protein
MNTPKAKAPKRHTGGRSPFDKGRLHGTYFHGIPPDFAQIIGHIVVQWALLEEEMIAIMASLLGDIHDSPARQVFRSLTSEQVRLKVMRSLLHEAKMNVSKSAFYDEVIAEFASLNKIRNSYVHGLWSTHQETGKVFIAEATSDEDFPFFANKRIVLKQLEDTLKRIIELARKVALQTPLAHDLSLPKKRVPRATADGS